ncbi:hypothetical protein RF11_00539 [Thelohanellus kitauei]|uniref:Uncharacterized protein n=1 Tax=Thelohanellus kitauei TaxID=669202 RepID=A0A0C2IVF3_THEKT|nr:hypothetical protein RF11_00539 [Thelohanellus kitauei]
MPWIRPLELLCCSKRLLPTWEQRFTAIFLTLCLAYELPALLAIRTLITILAISAVPMARNDTDFQTLCQKFSLLSLLPLIHLIPNAHATENIEIRLHLNPWL